MANTITFQEEVNRAKEAQKRWMITFAVIMVAVMLIPAFSLFDDAGGTAFDWSKEGLTISYPDGTAVSMPYESVNDISFSEGIRYGEAVTGGTEKQYRYGTWKNEEFGEYQLFTHLDFHHCIIFDTDNGFVVINFESNDTTAALYESVRQMLIENGHITPGE